MWAVVYSGPRRPERLISLLITVQRRFQAVTLATIEQAGSKWGDREGRGKLDSGLVSSPILSDWLLKLIQL